jgi:osmotically-inducible protein OsmY
MNALDERPRPGVPLLALAALLTLTAALATTGCKRTPDGYEIDPDAELRAKAAAEEAADEAKKATTKLEEAAKEAGEELQEQAGRAGEVVADEARQAGERLGEEAREVADRVRPELERRADDAAITARVKAKLLADPEVRSLEIDVDTVGGVVTLNGVVASEAARAEAEKHARQTEGVRQVVNLVRVGSAAAPAPRR